MAHHRNLLFWFLLHAVAIADDSSEYSAHRGLFDSSFEAEQDSNDFRLYLKFLRNHRSHEERRRMGSYSRRRFEVFRSTLRDIEDRRERDPGASYDINKFSDLSDDEFYSQWTSGHQHWNETIAEFVAAGNNGIDPQLQNDTRRRELLRSLSEVKVIDWRFHMGGKVSATKNQGGCGSCWAFAAIQQMESDHAIANGQVVTLSSQQITSCTYEPGRSGCNGGWPRDGISSAIKLGGLMLEKDYPYTGRSPPCEFDIEKAVTQPIALWHTKGPETPMIERIVRLRLLQPSTETLHRCVCGNSRASLVHSPAFTDSRAAV